MKTPHKIIIVYLASAVVGAGVYYAYRMLTKGKPASKPVAEVSTNSAPINEPVIVEPAEVPVEPVPVPQNPPLAALTSNAKVKLVVGKESYWYNVTGLRSNNEASANIEYVLKDGDGHIYASRDGRFTKVSANASGEYTVVIRDLDNGLESKSKTIGGFVGQTPVTRLSTAELEKLINTGDYDGCKAKLSGKLSDKPEIKGTGRSTIQELFMAVNLEGRKVSVVSLEYDCLGRITSIVVSEA